MYRATENFCGENASIVASNVAFEAAFNQFKANIASIVAAGQTDTVPLTGIAVDKNVLKQALCERAAETAALIYAYAATVGNNTLKAEVDFPVSDLTRMREDALPLRCQSIHDAGENHLPQLADYGITSATLGTLQGAINSYTAETPKPRTAISQRKTTTANLVALFEETDALLRDRLDKLVLIFKAAHPDFVKTYESTRRIVKPPTTHTQLKGTVTDKTDAAPVPNATVTVTPVNGNGSTPQSAVTNAAGSYCLKPVHYGLNNITVTAAGYQPFQLNNFDARWGEINDLKVELVK
jgi:hypothetical protein